MQLQPGPAQEPNVVVTGDASSLLGWLLPSGLLPNGQAQQPGQGVTITGDDTTLLETVAALRSFNPDFATTLGDLLGADQASSLLGNAEAGLKGLKSMVMGLNAGAQQQAHTHFVQRDDLDELLNGIDNLRLRIDRLAAKVRRQETGA